MLPPLLYVDGPACPVALLDVNVVRCGLSG